MMLLRFELSKIWKSRRFLKLFGLVLILNIFLFYVEEVKMKEIAPSSWGKMQEVLKTKDIDEQYNFLKDEKQRIDTCEIIDAIAQLKQDGNQKQIDVLNTQHKEALHKYRKQCRGDHALRYGTSLPQEKTIILDTLKKVKKLYDYPAYRQEIKQRSQQMNEISIFQTKTNDFSKLNIEKTAKDYQKLGTLSLHYEEDHAIMAYLQFPLTNIMVLFLCFVLVFELFQREKQEGVLNLIASTPKGRTATIFVKYAALIISAAIVTFVVYGTMFFFSGMLFSFNDLHQPLQSLPAFIQNVWPVSILGYLIINLLMKWLAYTLVSILLIFLLSQCFHMILAWIMAALIMFFQFCLTIWISPLSNLHPLIYLNLYSFCDMNKITMNYLNINILGYPISMSNAVFICILILFIVLCIFSFIRYRSTMSKQVKTLPKFTISIHSKHQWFYEAKKILIHQRCLIILLLFLGFQIYSDTNTHIYKGASQLTYETYLKHVEGKPSKKKAEYLKHEQDNIDKAYQKIAQYDKDEEAGILSKQEASMMKEPYMNIVMKEEILKGISKQYHRIEKLNPARMVNEYHYQHIFHDEKEMSSLILIVLLILSLSSIFSYDKLHGMESLLSSCVYGGRKRMKYGIILGMIISSILFVSTYLPSFLNTVSQVPLKHMEASIHCLSMFKELPFDMMIWQYLLLFYLMRLIAVYLVMVIVLALSHLVKKNMACITISALLLLSGMLGEYLNISFLSWSSILGVFREPFLFHLTYISGLLYLLILGIAAILYLYTREKQYLFFKK